MFLAKLVNVPYTERRLTNGERGGDDLGLQVSGC